MEIDALLTVALEKGLFAALFVFAFWYILTENKKREESQRDLYVKMSDSLEVVKDTITALEVSVKRTDANSDSIAQEVSELKFMIASLDTVVKSKIS